MSALWVILGILGITLTVRAIQKRRQKFVVECQHCSAELELTCVRRPGTTHPITTYFTCPVCGETNTFSGAYEIISVIAKEKQQLPHNNK